MSAMSRYVVGGLLGGVLVLSWMHTVGQDAAAQTPAAAVMKRFYTGTDGLSHVEDIPLTPNLVMEKIASVEVRTSRPGSFADWHPAPQRQYIINITGTAQIEVAEGKVDLPPGSIEYIDDLTGKGHTTRTIGTEPRVSLWLKFEDQTQRVGPIGPSIQAAVPRP